MRKALVEKLSLPVVNHFVKASWKFFAKSLTMGCMKASN
jgi:hypothetical protein